MKRVQRSTARMITRRETEDCSSLSLIYHQSSGGPPLLSPSLAPPPFPQQSLCPNMVDAAAASLRVAERGRSLVYLLPFPSGSFTADALVTMTTNCSTSDCHWKPGSEMTPAGRRARCLRSRGVTTHPMTPRRDRWYQRTFRKFKDGDKRQLTALQRRNLRLPWQLWRCCQQRACYQRQTGAGWTTAQRPVVIR